VEGRVGYARRNWLIGAGEFESWETLNSYLRERCRQDQGRRLRGKSQTIGERLQEEQAAMRPLPQRPFPCCKTVPVKANSLSLVSFGTNRYSVPVEVADEALTLHAYVDRIEISCGTEVVAVHGRCWDREQDLLTPQHYLLLLARKPRAFAHARAIREWQQVWPPIFDLYFELLKERYATSEATRYFVEVLQLSDRYSEAQLATALEEAVGRRCLQVADVRELLRRLNEEGAPLPAPLVEHPRLADIQVRAPDLNHFNQLLAWMGEEAS
jgi:hypothetical protein